MHLGVEHLSFNLLYLSILQEGVQLTFNCLYLVIPPNSEERGGEKEKLELPLAKKKLFACQLTI